MVAKNFEKLVNELLRSNSPKKWFRAYFNHGLINYIYGQKRLLPCDMSFDTFFIDPYGDVMPCNGTNLYTKENTGPGLTRKFGFEKSSGDLFFFVDSDDWVTTSDVFREINDLFEKNEKIDVLFFDREDIIGDTKDIIPGFNETREGFCTVH